MQTSSVHHHPALRVLLQLCLFALMLPNAWSTYLGKTLDSTQLPPELLQQRISITTHLELAMSCM